MRPIVRRQERSHQRLEIWDGHTSEPTLRPFLVEVPGITDRELRPGPNKTTARG